MKSVKVKSVKPTGKHKLFIVFTDGTEGYYKLSHLTGNGVFKSWDTENSFDKVFIDSESGAISWPGDLDIDTVNAYCTIKGIDPKDYFQHRSTHAPHL